MDFDWTLPLLRFLIYMILFLFLANPLPYKGKPIDAKEVGKELPLPAVKRTPRSIWNDGYRPDRGRSRRSANGRSPPRADIPPDPRAEVRGKRQRLSGDAVRIGQRNKRQSAARLGRRRISEAERALTTLLLSRQNLADYQKV